MPRLVGLAVDMESEFYHKPSVSLKVSDKVAKRIDATRMQGSVRKVKQDRGFGFIAGDDGRDHFFHWSGMEKSSKNFRELEVQDRVSFITIEGDKGPRAICIRVE